MKIGHITIGYNRQGKMQWDWKGEILVNPLLILWRMFWSVPTYILVGCMYVVLLIGQGKYVANEFLKNW